MSEKFLIIRLGAIGDLVHALPFAAALKNFFPESQVDWVVGDKFTQIIKDNPLVDNVYVANLSVWRKNWLAPATIKDIKALNKTLAQNKYDWAFDLHGMFKSAVITAFCGAKNKVAYRDYKELAPLAANVLIEPKSKRPHRNYHVIKRHMDLLSGSGLLKDEDLKNYLPHATLPHSNEQCNLKINKFLQNIDTSKPTVVFAPATTWVNKHWEEKNWQELYLELKDKVNIIFCGIEKDLNLINRIVQNHNEHTILAGQTNLSEYIEVLKRADLVISPDSSASHLAFACEKPHVITIFCATSKNTFKPLGDKNFAFPSREPVCLPCHKRKCKKNNMVCTKQTSAQEVYKKACEMLKL